MSKWELYDLLIDEIPRDLIVDYFCQGVHWTIVQSNGNMGVSMTIRQKGPKIMKNITDLEGMPLQEIASLIKSWDYYEASIGMAALNCYYNSQEKIRELGGFESLDLSNLTESDRIKNEVFNSFYDQLSGKKVAVIGHFPDLERRLERQCELSILEREPQSGDYPDPACEFILAEQVHVFITGTTFTNKTLPRLLEIIPDKTKINLVGPSVCFSREFFDRGVDYLSGFCILDNDEMNNHVRRGSQMQIFKTGVMINVGRGLA